ncbi:CinA family protein [Acidisoma sp.]|uniref:CinA family protein n=1 Tax=Acidisoma sp. TaxID=1872115 RepID=UPI003B00E12A
MFPQEMLAEAEAVLAGARARGWRITTAESCTGGLIAGLLTAIGGSSDVVDGGAVTYSNAAKTRMLGVPPELIASEGAVSEAVARAMAEGARRSAEVDLAISVTGVAGPGGGTATKPVGLIWFGVASPTQTIAKSRNFPGGRTSIRMATVRHAMALLRAELAEKTRYA